MASSNQSGGSTILIRNGSGSATPPELRQGELALNVDTGQLWYGSGSNADLEYPNGGATASSFTFGDLHIKGALTAEQYIISSSVTYVTTSFSSGSTEFGDTEEDTHNFTGSLFISGAATSSFIIGDVALTGSLSHTGVVAHTGSFYIKGDASDVLNIDIRNAIITGSAKITGSLVLTGSLLHSGSVKFSSSITISGSVDSDGYISASSFAGDGAGITNITTTNAAAGSDTHVQFNDGGTATGGEAGFTYNKTTDSITLVGNVTASGDISASKGKFLNLANTGSVENTQLTGSFTGSFTGDGSGIVGTIAGNVSGSNVIMPFTNITASGTISASGNLTIIGNVSASGTGSFGMLFGGTF